MDLKRLEKMRASCPSRKSMMDFLYDGNPPSDSEKPNTFEVGSVSSLPNDGIVAKEPFRDITNIQPSLNVGVQYEVVKRDRTTAGKKNAGSAITGQVVPNSHDEGYCVTNDETPDDDVSSITSERLKLNPNAPVFVQKHALEQRSVGSPTFEVSSQDLSDFNSEQSEPINDSSLDQFEDVEPRAICTPTHEVAKIGNPATHNERAQPVAEKSPYEHCVAIEPERTDTSTDTFVSGKSTSKSSFDKDESISPVAEKDTFKKYEATHSHSLDTPYYNITDAQSFDTPYYEIEDHQSSPSYHERLDTIFEEPETEKNENSEVNFTGHAFTNYRTIYPHEFSATCGNSSTTESETSGSLMSDSLATHSSAAEPGSPENTSNGPVDAERKKQTIRFDRDGDLYLEVGKKNVRTMLVDSRALGRASAKLRDVISQSTKEDTGHRWKISFPEEDPKSFAIILNLIHTRFEKVPTQLTLDRLYDVCTLAKKYGMTSVLRPVAERWYLSARTLEKASIFKMAFIAWEFGFQTDFGEILGYITHNCFTDEDSQLVFGPNKQRLSDNEILKKLPVLTCIEEHRQLALDTF
ncbi:hypothetical protein NW768_006357 [Fusarium equiseti]|uniref:BTB domain-containing protein n=1 Tax=Fusarium equiseti TaxID=61235 RepID=A0ABQ8RBA2_FUSEQ|nr:hypothetical protein NW768_006357 [Fusarium equiseti]